MVDLDRVRPQCLFDSSSSVKFRRNGALDEASFGAGEINQAGRQAWSDPVVGCLINWIGSPARCISNSADATISAIERPARLSERAHYVARRVMFHDALIPVSFIIWLVRPPRPHHASAGTGQCLWLINRMCRFSILTNGAGPGKNLALIGTEVV